MPNDYYDSFFKTEYEEESSWENAGDQMEEEGKKEVEKWLQNDSYGARFGYFAPQSSRYSMPGFRPFADSFLAFAIEEVDSFIQKDKTPLITSNIRTPEEDSSGRDRVADVEVKRNCNSKDFSIPFWIAPSFNGLNKMLFYR